MERRSSDRQIVSHLLAFFAGMIVAYFALPALQVPLHASQTQAALSSQSLPPIDAPPNPVPVPQAQAQAQAQATVAAAPLRSAFNDQLIIPVQGVSKAQLVDTYTQSRSGNRLHNAIDIMAAQGTPVLAAQSGVIAKLHQSAAGGITIYVFNPQRTFSYYYAHLSAYAPGLHEGQTVQRGEVIGYVGHTGNASPTGPHLHFQVNALAKGARWSDGEPLNPYPLLMNAQELRE